MSNRIYLSLQDAVPYFSYQDLINMDISDIENVMETVGIPTVGLETKDQYIDRYLYFQSNALSLPITPQEARSRYGVNSPIPLSIPRIRPVNSSH